VVRNVTEILVRRQHRQIVAYAQLSQEGIDRANLYAVSSAAIPELRGCDVIVAVRHEQRDGGKPVQNLIARLRPRKTLKQFLKDKAGGQDGLAAAYCPDERFDFRCRRRIIPTQRE
jgi:hypothetical protein